MGKKSNSPQSFLNRAMYTCEEATLKISKSFHQKLTFSERQRLKIHMAVCKPCRDFKFSSSVLDHGIHKLGRKNELRANFKLSETKKEQLKKLLKQEND